MRVSLFPILPHFADVGAALGVRPGKIRDTKPAHVGARHVVSATPPVPLAGLVFRQPDVLTSGGAIETPRL